MGQRLGMKLRMSFNRKSKTCAEPRRNFQNLKWVCFFAMVVALPMSMAVAQTQQPPKVARIGYLDPSTRGTSARHLGAFRQEMSRLGWIDKKNLVMEYRFAEQQPKRLLDLADDLVRLKVDVIVCSSTPATLAAKKATTTIPIVMASSGDAVEAGLVASLSRPGRQYHRTDIPCPAISRKTVGAT